MKSILIRKFKTREDAIKKAAQILREKLKPGDIILTSPRLNNIKLKIRYFSSYLIGKLSRGITHSCLYIGNNRLMDMDIRLRGKAIQNITLEQLLKKKIDRFKGIKVYVVQPKRYKKWHRDIVLKESINNFINKSKDIIFSVKELSRMFFILTFKKSETYKKDTKNLVKRWHCSNLVAYILRKSGVNIGNRASNSFIPSTFVFSKHFKVKKKIVIK
ncbi:MAG: hypothetical protein AABX61_00840 [Nanoarchaeota archaeon]